MDELFAPWRIEYVTRDRDEHEGCPFCAMWAGETDTADRVVARADASYVVLNHAPYNPGHCLIIPGAHVGSYDGLDDATLWELAWVQRVTIAVLEETLETDGMNVGVNLGGAAAGGSIPEHLHVHVVPRWAGDTNVMPVIGETKVIVEALDATRATLHAGFAAHPAARGPTDPASAVQLEAPTGVDD
jgi:ATP adenylyltransferase